MRDIGKAAAERKTMKNSEFVTNWVLDTVKEQYPEDIALVVSHTTLRIEEEEKTVSFFVPATKKGFELARTFILAGEGFDIWAIPWERLKRFADLEEYNITVLADAQILYARSEEDAARFRELQNKQKENLADVKKMRICALQAYAQAKNIYLEMLFAKGSDVKLGAGYVLDYLAQAVAFSNCRYFQKSQTEQMTELQTFDHVPEKFIEKYLQILKERDEEIQKKLCYEQICLVQAFLEEMGTIIESVNEVPKEHNFQDLADWYAELSYTWLRIRHYAAQKDTVKVYMWGILLQEELNQVCGDFGLEKQELMDYYDADKLDIFVSQADIIEGKMRQMITEGGGVIHEYASVEEFLNEV